jgi:hypothetical protein
MPLHLYNIHVKGLVRVDLEDGRHVFIPKENNSSLHQRHLNVHTETVFMLKNMFTLNYCIGWCKIYTIMSTICVLFTITATSAFDCKYVLYF